MNNGETTEMEERKVTNQIKKPEIHLNARILRSSDSTLELCVRVLEFEEITTHFV